MSEQEKELGFFQVLKSVIASFLGIQNNRTRERDFTRGRPRDFILVALLLTVIFILSIWGLVQLVMSVAKG